MKASFQEAASLFRENEMQFGDVKQDKEKANLYRGLVLLAEGLARLDARLDQLEAAQVEVAESTTG
ncbi:MAG: hypothetical protein JWR69_16 [Pedosphaera sp.]|nr:hypothetical protein [Pedosphaera sp.]